MSQAVSETELKFQLEPDAARQLPARPEMADAKTTRLRSIYFDTPGCDLYQRGMALRVRQAGSRFVQTLKVGRGAGDLARDEWEVELQGDEPDLKALRRTPAADSLDREPLNSLFETAVFRTTSIWSHDGSQVEVSLDEGEVRAGTACEPILELELELKAGDPKALFALAREIAGDVPLRLSFEAKSSRGYRLIGREDPAGSAAEAPVSRGRPTGEAFRALARDCLAQIAGCARELQLERSPRALHQTRVGLRRLRAALSVFKPVLHGAGYEAVKAEAKWLAKALDGARDLDVFIEDTLEPGEAPPGDVVGLKRLGDRVKAAKTDAYGDALDAIGSPRFFSLLLDTAEWIELGDWLSDQSAERRQVRDGPVEAFAAQALEHRHKRLMKRGKGLADLAPDERHQVRIEGKKLRYAAELLGPAFGAKAGKGFVDKTKALQDCLGVLNDIVVAQETAAHMAEGEDASVAFAAGVLVGRRLSGQDELLKNAVKAFRKLKGADRFWASPG